MSIFSNLLGYLDLVFNSLQAKAARSVHTRGPALGILLECMSKLLRVPFLPGLPPLAARRPAARVGRVREAELEYRRAVRIYGPDDGANVRDGLAWLLLTIPEFLDPEEALLHARRAHELDNEKPEIGKTYALALLLTGDAKEAAEVLTLGPEPEKPRVRCLRSLILAAARARLGQIDEAQKCLTVAANHKDTVGVDQAFYDRLCAEVEAALRAE